jgi:predicted metal-dependent hydrolase
MKEEMTEQTKEFVRLFNEERDFYECHEVFERAWKAESKEPLKSFYKAMVQVATAQFKIDQGLLNGVRKLYSYSIGVLDALPDVYQGLDLARLRREFTEQVQSLPALSVIEKGTFRQYGLDFLSLGIVGRTCEEEKA